jgi:hypothetical protein
MKPSIFMAMVFGSAAIFSASAEDMLRFGNGDQLHGKYQGIGKDGDLKWQREDIADAVGFKTDRLRHVVLAGGKARPLRSISNIGLVNGDRLPCEIKSIDANDVVINTVYAGEIRVPRDAVAMLAPSPLGGRLHYHGPFAEDEWKIWKQESVAQPSNPEKQAPVRGQWFFSGSAWYWKGERGGDAIFRESCMPERSVLRFDLASKSRLGIVLGFHLDFAKRADPEKAHQPVAGAIGGGDIAEFAQFCGSGYIMQLYSNYVMMYRCEVGKDGIPRLERFQSGILNVRMGDLGHATVEIRSNPAQGSFSLFLNDEFAAQWSEPPSDEKPLFKPGAGIAMAAHGDNLVLRVSDIMISEWNGMPDSARSMEMEDEDVVLMADGVDRYSGRVGSLDKNGRLMLEAKHGGFAFPLADVAEVRFAKNRLVAKPDHMSARALAVRFEPIGVICGQPESSEGNRLKIKHSILGAVDLSLESAVMLDFTGSKYLVDEWDGEFR